MIGLIEPAARPATATVAKQAHSGGSVAKTSIRGPPQSRNDTTNSARRGTRYPMTPNMSEPTSAPPPIAATSRPSATEPPRLRSANTGSITRLQAASKKFVTRINTVIARIRGWRHRKARPSRSSCQ